MSDPLDALQLRLGYRFRSPALLTRALTHRSFGAEHNERLEFLGDAVLGTAVARLLFERFAGGDEGDLSRVRAHLVREDSLHRIALALRIGEGLRLSKGELRAGAVKPSILADALEAIIGAVFVDGGYEAAQALVQRLMGEVIAATSMDAWTKDPKTELQEWLHARELAVPVYTITATRGEKHAPVFEVECAVAALDTRARGEGRSRRAAEQEAARQVLERLKAGDERAPRRA